MPLINFEINLILNWLENCVNCEGNRITTFAITDTKLYVPVATLLTNDNSNLSKEHVLDSDPKAMQQIIFTGNLD